MLIDSLNTLHMGEIKLINEPERMRCKVELVYGCGWSIIVEENNGSTIVFGVYKWNGSRYERHRYVSTPQEVASILVKRF